MDPDVLRRLEELEARCAKLERIFAIAPAPVPPVPPLPLPPVLPKPALPAAVAPVALPEPPSLEARVGLMWLNRIGVITLILGVAFAFKTAVDNNWIGPVGRIALGVAAGIGTLAGGELLWRRGQGVFARGLTALGIGILYLSWWAAFALYQLVPQEVAFGMMVATTAGSVTLAVRYDAQPIAVLAMLGGYITPLVLSTGEPQSLIFLAYVALVNAGGFELGRRRGWTAVEHVAMLATVALFGGWLVAGELPGERNLATVFVLVFYAQLATARQRTPWFVAQPLAALAIAALWPVGEVLPLLLVLAGAGLAVAEVRHLREAPLVTCVSFWGGYAAWAAARVASPAASLELLALAVGFAGFAAWLVSRRLREKALGELDLLLLGISAGAYFAASYRLVEEPYLGGFAVALAIVHFALARVLWDTRDLRPGTLALGIGAAFFTLAVPLQFAGVTVTIAWALEGACIAWLAARFSSARLALAAYGALAIACGHLLYDTDAYSRIELAVVANPRLLAFAITAASLFATARLLRRPVAYVAGHVVALLGIAFELESWAAHATPGTFTVALSIAMALYAVVLVMLGVVRKTALDRVLGLGLLGLVVAKLYASDVWQLGRPFRIAAFLVLGAVLLLVSYVYSRRSDRA